MLALPKYIGSTAVFLLAIAFTSCAGATPGEKQPPPWTLERITSLEAPPEGLTYVGNALAAPNGDVVLQQSSDLRLAVFSQDGKFRRFIGRKGDGPGELRSIAAFGFVDDTLWTIDRVTRRVSYFELTGAFIGSEQIEPLGTADLERVLPAALRSSASELLASIPSTIGGNGTALGLAGIPEAVIARRSIQKLPVFAMSRTGALRRVIASIEPYGTIEVPGANGDAYVQHPFKLGTVFRFGAGAEGLTVADVDAAAEHVSVVQYSVDGSVRLRISVPYVRVAVPPGYADSMAESIASMHRKPELARPIAAAMSGFREFPPVTDLLWSTGGLLFLRGWPTSRHAPWTIVARDGRVLGKLDVPLNARPLFAEADRLWMSEVDNMGEEKVVIYRLRGG